MTDCCTKEREREQLGAAAPPGCCQPHDAVGARSGRDGAGALAAGGSVLAAILSSACCWLPLLLIAFGASAAGVAGFFETYRPYFLAGAISLLGLGFYTVYVRHGECEPGSACARPKRKLRVFNRLMLWTATVLVTAFSFFPSYVGRVFGPSSRPSSEADHGGFATAAFAIEGMTCEGCATTLSTVLVNLPGVRAARVDFEAKTAFVQFEPDRPLPADRVIEAVRAAGFTAASSDQSP